MKRLALLLVLLCASPLAAWDFYGAAGDVASVAAKDLSNVDPATGRSALGLATGTLGIANGGTGATTAAAALTALGFPYKIATFSIITPSEPASVATILHGLDSTKVVAVHVLGWLAADTPVPPNSPTATWNFDYFMDGTKLYVITGPVSGLQSKTVTYQIWYLP